MKLEELRKRLENDEAPKTPRPDPKRSQKPRWSQIGATVVHARDANVEALQSALVCACCGLVRLYFYDAEAKVYIVEPCRACSLRGAHTCKGST